MSRLSAWIVAGLVLAALANAAPTLAGTADAIMENNKINKMNEGKRPTRPRIVCPRTKCEGGKMFRCSRSGPRCSCRPMGRMCRP